MFPGWVLPLGLGLLALASLALAVRRCRRSSADLIRRAGGAAGRACAWAAIAALAGLGHWALEGLVLIALALATSALASVSVVILRGLRRLVKPGTIDGGRR